MYSTGPPVHSTPTTSLWPKNHAILCGKCSLLAAIPIMLHNATKQGDHAGSERQDTGDAGNTFKPTCLPTTLVVPIVDLEPLFYSRTNCLLAEFADPSEPATEIHH